MTDATIPQSESNLRDTFCTESLSIYPYNFFFHLLMLMTFYQFSLTTSNLSINCISVEPFKKFSKPYVISSAFPGQHLGKQSNIFTVNFKSC